MSFTQAPFSRLTFGELIAPLGSDEFLSRFWTREAVHCQARGRTFDESFGWPAVSTILNSGGLTVPKVIVVQAGQELPSGQFCTGGEGTRVDPTAVLGLFEQGATFIITRADSHSPELRRIAGDVQDFFLESVSINAYCSPASIQGIDFHYDTHEVLVLQIEGAKRWKIFRPTIDAPLVKFQKEDAPPIVDPYLDVTLRKGDVLYVPRGHWHYAIAEDEPSLHVTVGIRCRTGKTFVDWLSEELARQGLWRRNLPLIDSVPPGSGEQPGSQRDWAHAVKRSLNEMLEQPDLFERFWSSMRDKVRTTPEVNLPLQLSASASAWGDAVRFERPAGRRHSITVAGASSVTINANGCEIALDGVNPALVERIFRADAFALADARQWDPHATLDDLRGLLSGLVQAGLLVVRG